MTRQGKARQGNARQDEARQDKTRQDKTRHWAFNSQNGLDIQVGAKAAAATKAVGVLLEMAKAVQARVGAGTVHLPFVQKCPIACVSSRSPLIHLISSSPLTLALSLSPFHVRPSSEIGVAKAWGTRRGGWGIRTANIQQAMVKKVAAAAAVVGVVVVVVGQR